MLKVGIVGAGEGGTSILKTLMSVSGIQVIGICDTNRNAPGIVYAREHNIPIYEHLKNILEIEGKKLLLKLPVIKN
jgi:methyl-accepting chemotaxis protein